MANKKVKPIYVTPFVAIPKQKARRPEEIPIILKNKKLPKIKENRRIDTEPDMTPSPTPKPFDSAGKRRHSLMTLGFPCRQGPLTT